MAHAPWHRTTKKETIKSDRPTGMPAFLSYTQPKKPSEKKDTKGPVVDMDFQIPGTKVKEPVKTQRPTGMPDFLTYVPPKKDVMPPLNWMDEDIPQTTKFTVQPKITSWTQENAPFISSTFGSLSNTFLLHWNKNKEHWDSKVQEARNEWIYPTDSWVTKKLKDLTITTVIGAQATGTAILQTGVSATLEPIGAVTAATVANGNDIHRAIQGMEKLSQGEKENLMDSVNEHVVMGTLAYFESTAFGAMKIGPIALPSTRATATFIANKVPFEFNNAIKAVKNIKAKNRAKNMAENMTVEGEWHAVTEAAIKHPEVKREIKQLAIQSWEQEHANIVGTIQANNVANHLRQTNNIMTVAPLSIGAAVTPKKLLPPLKQKELLPPLEQKTLGEPFFNPIQKAVSSLPVNESGHVQVRDLKIALTQKKLQQLDIRKIDRAMMLTNFNDFVANLDESNVKTVPIETINKYINDNPIELTINVGESFIPEKLIKEKSDAQKWQGSFFNDLSQSVSITSRGHLGSYSNVIRDEVAAGIQEGRVYLNPGEEFPTTISEAVQKGYNFGDANFPEKQLDLEAAVNNTSYPAANNITGLKLFKNIMDNKITTWSEEYPFDNTTLELVKEFEDGKVFVKDHLGNFRVNEQGTLARSGENRIKVQDVLQHFKNKIMYNVGYQYNQANELTITDFLPERYDPLTEADRGLDDITDLNVRTSSEERLILRKQWVDTLLNNFNTRKHMDKEGDYEYIMNAPVIKAESFVYDNKPITSDLLIKMAEGSSPARAYQSYYSIMANLRDTLNIIMNNLELRDIPEWPLFMDTLKSYQGFTLPNTAENTRFVGWEKAKQNLVENQKAIDIVDKKIEMAELTKPTDVRPYVYEEPYKRGQYETHITYKKGEHAGFDKYFELRLTANDLSGYPDFYPEYIHFGDIKNVLGWTLATKRTINKTPLNPKGETMMVAEEIQAPQPYTGASTGGVPAATNPWRGLMTEKSRYILGEPVIPKDNIQLFTNERTGTSWNQVPVGHGHTSRTDEIMFLDKPLYTLFDKEGKWKGDYQIDDDGTIISYVSGADLYRSHKEEFPIGELAFTNKESVLPERVGPGLPVFSRFDSIEQYKDKLDKGVDVSDIIKSRELGGIAEADWYKKVLWADIRFAYDNGFDYLAIPTSKTINNKAGSGGNYDTLPAVAAKWGFEVISDVESGKYIGTPMENFGLGGMSPDKDPARHLRDFDPERDTMNEIEWLNENYGDDKIHIIDLRNREKVFEILNVPQQVGSLKQQTEQLLRLA